MKSILFVSSFLSGVHHTKDVAETISEKLIQYNIFSKLVSFKKNKLFRLIDIIINVIVFKGEFVHIHTFSDQAFRIAIIASYIAKIRKKKIIFTLHGGKLAEFEVNNTEKVFKTLKRAHKILTPSLFLQSHFVNKGYIVDYLPNPIDLTKFPFKEKLEIKSLKILWVRAFVDIYNPDLAIKALLKIHKKYPEATLTMVGPDRGLRKKCVDLIKDLKLEKSINLVGSVANENLYKYYQTHDVYINTTSYESFGLALMEAASCGIPIVSSEVGEIPFIWQHKKNIMLSSSLDSSSFAEQILELVSNHILKKNIVLNAKELSKKYDIELVKIGWLKILN